MVHPDRPDPGLAIRNITVVGDTYLAQSILDALGELDPPRQLTLLIPSTAGPSAHSPLLSSSTTTTTTNHHHSDSDSDSDSHHSHPHHPIRHLPADFSSPSSLRAALAGQDLVISTDGGGGGGGDYYAAQTRLVNAAVQARVPRFVPAEFGADSLNERVAGRLPPHAQRARLIGFLRAMESEGKSGDGTVAGGDGDGDGDGEVGGDEGGGKGGCCADGCGHGHGHGDAEGDAVEVVQTSGGFDDPFSWVAVAAGALLGARLDDLGFDIKWQSATVYGDGDGDAGGRDRAFFAVSSLAWVGRSVARVVERWDAVRNSYLYAAGAVTSADEVVACLQAATGKEWAVGTADVAECVAEAERCLRRGFPDAGIALMERSVLYDTSLGAVDSFRTKSANDLLGLGREKVEDIIIGAVHDFQNHGKADCGCS
ncbi:uncharacterized protein BKCO1_1200061 [Diplodia corticola]|uniref:NmrA-like domain-containing protein n=1 Tax=Diplodia corticola TaxID=236234 RepID=A0A1J9S9H6_9PEZI|nr:uncharacterized protein BKCO1_1200061 [Diplodia corticola]OJD36237.1 hypothetical protein BKCO1_1200061 [Diplodia corticola]